MYIFAINPVSFKSISFKNRILTFDEANEQIKKGNIEEIKNLPDLFIMNKKLNTLLHSSAKNNQIEISRFLLNKKLDPNRPNINGQTPFATACSKLNKPLVETFLLYDVDVNTQDCLHNTPLHRAVQSPEIVNLLLNHNANPHTINDFEQTPYSMSADYPESLKVFLQHKVNPNTVDKNGQNLMHKAMKHGDMELAELLKEYGADVNYKDKSGKSPLFYVKDSSCIDWLSKNGVKINLKDKKHQTALHYSVMDNNGSISKTLLKHNADPNILNGESLPPIAYAKSLGMLKLLLDNGANPDILIPGGTLLHKYTKADNLKNVHCLMTHSANPNIPDEKGFIPIDYAKDGNMRTLLLAAGTNPNYRNYLTQALKTKDFEFFSNLLEAGANPNKPNEKGQTPAFFINDEKELKELLNYGADINYKNLYGYTPVLHFALLGRRDIVGLFKLNNVEINEADLKACYEKYTKYHNWIKPVRSKGVAFTGEMDYTVYGTDKIRKELKYKVQLSEARIDKIIEGAKTTDAGLKEAYLALKEEEKHIKTAIQDMPVVIKHFNIDAKEELNKIAKMNPSGSKIPIIGVIKQYQDTILTSFFKDKLISHIDNIRDCKNDIIKNYYNNGIMRMADDYQRLNNYLSEGIKYVSYADKSTPFREKLISNLEISKNKFIQHNNKLKSSLDNLTNSYEGNFSKILEYQEKKQQKRTSKKTVMTIVGGGAS